MTESVDRSGAWFESAFGRLYPLIYSHRDDVSAAREVEGLLSWLVPEAGGIERVLDVACGSGRHTEAIARLGFRVVGIDLSEYLLPRAAQRPSLKGRVARADMRRLPFGPSFDLVTNLFTSFGYFESDGENKHALSEMARVLRPKGILVLDHMNPMAVKKGLEASSVEKRRGLQIRIHRRIEGSRVIKEIDVKTDRGEGFHLVENVRLYEPDEMRALFVDAGLAEVQLFGNFRGEAFTEASDRMIAAGTREGRSH
jgi:SAM-dependent methyltransferase